MKIFFAGEGSFRKAVTKEELEHMGYITKQRACKLFSMLLDETNKEDCKRFICELNVVKIGDKRLNSYYKENEVVSYITDLNQRDASFLH